MCVICDIAEEAVNGALPSFCSLCDICRRSQTCFHRGLPVPDNPSQTRLT